MFGAAWDYYSSKLKGKYFKQETSPKNYKTEIKILKLECENARINECLFFNLTYPFIKY